MSSRWVLLLILLTLSVTACVSPAAQRQLEDAGTAPARMQPSFAPTEQVHTGASPTASPTEAGPPSPTGSTPPATTPTPTDRAVPSPTPRPAVTAQGAIRDATGDVESSALEDPPDHADLVAAHLDLSREEATLRIELRGGAPTESEDGHTMNVASFYDIDGDGAIDYEIWANLSPSGWGTSWFDNRQGQALYGADDEVAVDVVDERLVLRFPRHYLGGADSFRWSLASEWGTYEALRLGRMTKDHAPDEGRPSAFPD